MKDKIVHDRVRIDASAYSVTAISYAAGVSLGSRAEFRKALGSEGTGVIEQLVIVDRDKQKAPVDIIWFSAVPSGSTINNNVAVTIGTNDMIKCIGVTKVLATDFVDVNNCSVGSVTIPLPFNLQDGNTTLYAAIINRGAPTYTATNSLQLSIIIRRD